jgi:hypothetical protein
MKKLQTTGWGLWLVPLKRWERYPSYHCGGHLGLYGGEVIINENLGPLHCEELNKINQSTGGRAILRLTKKQQYTY